MKLLLPFPVMGNRKVRTEVERASLDRRRARRHCFIAPLGTHFVPSAGEEKGKKGEDNKADFYESTRSTLNLINGHHHSPGRHPHRFYEDVCAWL